MSVNLDIKDFNYPENTKRVTLDLDNIVPTNNYGDETLLITANTSAYSDNDNRTSIPGLYVTEGNVGWLNSSSLIGAGGYLLSATHNTLAVKLDATVSGTASTGYYEIELDYNVNGTPKSGSEVAEDIQTKLRAVNCDTVDLGFKYAYKNAYSVYKDGMISISSGTVSNDYDGPNRSSVEIGTAQANDCADLLGFTIGTSSMNFAGSSLESLVADYTHDTASLTVGLNSGILAGDALVITDKDGQEDYFTALSVAGNIVTVATQATNGFTAIANDYLSVDLAYVQVLKRHNPNQKVASYFNNTDELLRYMTTYLINQIDFSG